MNITDFSLLLGMIWMVFFIVVSGLYMIAMGFALSLAKNRFVVFAGCWFLNPESFPTEEGRQCCKWGALLTALQAVLMLIKFLWWGSIVNYLYSAIQ